METEPMTIRPETISALSILYEHCDKSLIQVLTPIVIDVLYKEEQKGKSIPISQKNYPEIKGLLNKMLGLALPSHVITLICEEAMRQNLLINVGAFKPPILNREKAKENNYSFSAMDEQSACKWKKLRGDIIEQYSRNQFGSISDKTVDNTLLEFIRINSSDFLSERGKSGDDGSHFCTTSKYQELTRISMCIANIAEDPSNESYQFLVDLCLGNSLVSAIFWWDDEQDRAHLSNLDVYLDSPIIFQLLGFGDDGQQDAAADLVETLKARGAHLCVFEHVLSEVMNIFESSKMWIGNPNYDPAKASRTTQKVIEHRLSAVELEKVIDGIPSKLEEIGIGRRDALSANTIKDHQIDEAKLRQMIESAYELRDRNMDATINVDIQSIGSIHKLRNGKSILHLNRAQAVLCTSNKTLSEVSIQFERDEYNRPDRAIPLCITDNSLATIAWLESPNKGKRVAQRRVIAQINTLIEPTANIKRRFCDELNERKEKGLITNSEYLAIIRESEVNRILARKTGNNPNMYTGETLDSVINEMLEEKSIQKNEEIRKKNKILEEKSRELDAFRNRENVRAKRWGYILLVAFIALVNVPSILVAFFFSEYRIATIVTTIIADILIAVVSKKIQQLGFDLYKKATKI